MLAPTSVARAPLMRGNVHVSRDSTWHLGGDAECISERRTASGREEAIRIAERASTTFASRYDYCTRGDLMFAACVISNSCAWQK
jgi:hypothetical protein